MKRATIIAKGEVQGVGYRGVVFKIARKLNITGFVENIKPYDVRIIAEGEKGNLDNFVQQIKIDEHPILVEEVDVTFEEPTGEFEYFEIRRGDITEELGERLDLARVEMGKLHRAQKDTLGKLDSMLEKQDSMLEKQDSMLEKQDSMLEKQDSMLEKQDVMIGKQDETITAIGEVSEKIDRSKEEIVTEIRGLREDLRSYMEDKFARIEQEIGVIKAKIGMV